MYDGFNLIGQPYLDIIKKISKIIEELNHKDFNIGFVKVYVDELSSLIDNHKNLFPSEAVKSIKDLGYKVINNQIERGDAENQYNSVRIYIENYSKLSKPKDDEKKVTQARMYKQKSKKRMSFKKAIGISILSGIMSMTPLSKAPVEKGIGQHSIPYSDYQKTEQAQSLDEKYVRGKLPKPELRHFAVSIRNLNYSLDFISRQRNASFYNSQYEQMEAFLKSNDQTIPSYIKQDYIEMISSYDNLMVSGKLDLSKEFSEYIVIIEMLAKEVGVNYNLAVLIAMVESDLGKKLDLKTGRPIRLTYRSIVDEETGKTKQIGYDKIVEYRKDKNGTPIQDSIDKYALGIFQVLPPTMRVNCPEDFEKVKDLSIKEQLEKFYFNEGIQIKAGLLEMKKVMNGYSFKSDIDKTPSIYEIVGLAASYNFGYGDFKRNPQMINKNGHETRDYVRKLLSLYLLQENGLLIF